MGLGGIGGAPREGRMYSLGLKERAAIQKRDKISILPKKVSLGALTVGAGVGVIKGTGFLGGFIAKAATAVGSIALPGASVLGSISAGLGAAATGLSSGLAALTVPLGVAALVGSAVVTGGATAAAIFVVGGACIAAKNTVKKYKANKEVVQARQEDQQANIQRSLKNLKGLAAEMAKKPEFVALPENIKNSFTSKRVLLNEMALLMMEDKTKGKAALKNLQKLFGKRFSGFEKHMKNSMKAMKKLEKLGVDKNTIRAFINTPNTSTSRNLQMALIKNYAKKLRKPMPEALREGVMMDALEGFLQAAQIKPDNIDGIMKNFETKMDALQNAYSLAKIMNLKGKNNRPTDWAKGNVGALKNEMNLSFQKNGRSQKENYARLIGWLERAGVPEESITELKQGLNENIRIQALQESTQELQEATQELERQSADLRRGIN